MVHRKNREVWPFSPAQHTKRPALRDGDPGFDEQPRGFPLSGPKDDLLTS